MTNYLHWRTPAHFNNNEVVQDLVQDFCRFFAEVSLPHRQAFSLRAFSQNVSYILCAFLWCIDILFSISNSPRFVLHWSHSPPSILLEQQQGMHPHLVTLRERIPLSLELRIAHEHAPERQLHPLPHIASVEDKV
jgi:hypothetical protein